MMQVIREHAHAPPEARGTQHHALGLPEHDLGLVALGRGTVHIRARLTVEEGQQQADPGRERTLAILPADLDVKVKAGRKALEVK